MKKTCNNCFYAGVSYDSPNCNTCRDLNKWRKKSVKPKPETAPKNNIQEGKARMSLLPMDVLQKYLVPAYEEGIIKYDRESWRKGFNTSIMIDATLRHIGEFFWENCDIDSNSSTNKHHLAGAIFSLLCILQTLDKHPELDDRCKDTGMDGEPQ